jgi:hypothetical protein
VPGEVLALDAEDPTALCVVDPKAHIKDVFRPGKNECIVRLGCEFGRDCLAKQDISAFGVPKTYLSPFAQRAFYSITANKLQNYDALKERVEKKEEEDKALVTRWELERSLHTKVTEEDVEASKFRAMMSDQSGFSGDMKHRKGSMGVANSAEQSILLLTSVQASFMQMTMCRQGLINATERQALKLEIVEWLDVIDNVFKFYSGMGADAGTATMSKSEFSHFINGSKIFHDSSRVREHIDACFAAANEEDARPGPVKVAGAEDDNPDEELMRFEFIECLIRLSQVKRCKH